MGNYLNSYKIPIIQKTEVINDEFREEIIKKDTIIEEIKQDIITEEVIKEDIIRKQMIKEEYYFDKYFISVLNGSLNKKIYSVIKITDNKIIIKFKQYMDTYCIVIKNIIKNNNVMYTITLKSDIININIIEDDYYYYNNIFCFTVGDLMDKINNLNNDLYYIYLEKNNLAKNI